MIITCTWEQAQAACLGRYGDIIYIANATTVQKFATERGHIFVLNPDVTILEFLGVWPNAKEVTNIAA